MSRDVEVELKRMTRGEIAGRLRSGELAACVLPVGAIEQHLDHLTLGHDWRSACHVAREVASRLSPRVAVAEGLMAGISEEHMKHPGTLTLGTGSFLAVLSDLIESLVRAGFAHVLVLNGHYGNIAACRAAWPQFQRRFAVNLQFLTYWDVLDEDDARELLRGGHRMPADLPGHAQEFETSIALAAFPEEVRRGRLDAIPEDGIPILASEDAGREFLERIISRVARCLSEMIDGTRHEPAPAYFP